MSTTGSSRERGVANAALLVAALLWLLAVWPEGAVQEDVPPLDPARAEGAARLLLGEPLDLNRADHESLEALPGIGPARARAIVRERERAPFRSVGELQRVRGIGPRTVAGLEGLLRVEPPARDAPGDAG